jgi:hypothetical protein
MVSPFGGMAYFHSRDAGMFMRARAEVNKNLKIETNEEISDGEGFSERRSGPQPRPAVTSHSAWCHKIRPGARGKGRARKAGRVSEMK